MGAYLSQPVTKKEVAEGGHPHLPFGVVSMQGWRRTMEDAHLADVSTSAPEGVFGVFDGHGGSEVAKFCQKYLASRVRAHDGFASKRDVPGALADCFHEIDAMLASDSHAAELEAMRSPPAPPLHLVKFGSNEDEEKEKEEEEEEEGKEEEKEEGAEGAPSASGSDGDNSNSNGDGDGGAEEEERRRRCSSSSSASASDATASADAASFSSSSSSKQDSKTEDKSKDAAKNTQSNNAPSSSSSKSPPPPPPPPPPRPPPLNLPPPEERVVAGCTAVVAAVVEGTVYVANAGDSRAVLLDAQGRARPLSVDHKPAAPAEAARIRAAGGFVSSFGGVARVNGNLSLSRAIGDLQYKGNDRLARHEQVVTAEPDVTTTELTAGDEFLLLACDGVWDVLTNQGAADVVARELREGRSAAEAAAALLDACLSPDPRQTRGAGCDNMTAAVVLLPTRRSKW